MHPEIDRFAHIESPLHRWDPRWKIASLFVLMLAFGSTGDSARLHPEWGRDLPPALASLAVSLFLVQVSRIPAGAALRSLKPVLLFFCFFLLVLPWTHPERSLEMGWLHFSTTGLLIAVLMAVRGVAISLLIFPLFGTTRFEVSMRALHSLKVPSPLVQLAVFTYRYIFVYLDEVRRLQIAWKARGFRKRCDMRTLRTLGNGAGMLVVGSLERSQRIHHAMKCRGYSGTFRTLEEPRMRPADLAKAAAAILAAAAFFLWRAW